VPDDRSGPVVLRSRVGVGVVGNHGVDLFILLLLDNAARPPSF
jgi:hypothetical protein